MKVEFFLETRGDLNDLTTVERQAELAEASGGDTVIAADGYSDGLLPLMLAARATTKIRLATGILVAFPRSPMVTAIGAWNVQAYSGGRFELGLGSQVKGHIERRYSTEWLPPGPRMRDYVLALRAIFRSLQSGEPLEFASKHYNFDLMTPWFRPPDHGYGPIPISIAAVSPYMLRLAGEISDCVRLHRFVSRRYLEEVVVPQIDRGVRLAGRQEGDLDVSGGALIGIGRDEAEVRRLREQLRSQVAFFASTRTYSGNFDIYGWQTVVQRLHELSLEHRWDDMTNLVSDEMLDEFAVLGTFGDIAKPLYERLGRCVNRLFLQVPLLTQEDGDNASLLVRSLHEAWQDGG